ncbi:MAG: FAD-binding oxidoreductase [Mesorhizobium sp.]|nr:FAD-dependent oxidoreductase [Mesorhizobium sp.]MCO5159496.1 FAD-binding oxidoreductase [Mesorhizobium sp.]
MEVVVVGAGIAGLSTAWSLAKRGHRVTLLEQGPIPNPLAASGDHHRIIRRAYPSGSGYGRAITEAYAAWQEMWADLGQSHYDPRGFVCLSREPGDEAEDYLEGLKEGGFPFELLSADETASRWPFFDPATIRYAFFSEEGGALHSRRIASGLSEWLRANDVDVREGARVDAVDADAGVVTLADGATLSADFIVVAAGAWVTKLFPDLAGTLTTKRTAVVYLEPPANLRAAWDKAPVVLDVGGKIDGYIIPRSGGGGLKFGTGLHKRVHPDADADRVPRPGEGAEILAHFSPPIARLAEYRVLDVVTCAYTFTADECFFATRKARALIVSACSGHGYKFGAAVGRRVADTVEDGDVARLHRWLRAETA